MRIYPINQSPIMFRGNVNNNHSTLKRYCEPRTGVYYYYDSVEFEKGKSQNKFSTIFNNIANKFNSMSKEVSDTFTLSNVRNANSDDTLWL